MFYLLTITGELPRTFKESLNNVSIHSNRTLNFKNSALDFQDEASFA